jgi:hypothetical protein
MKRKISATLKTLSALFVSLALVLSTAGPARAEKIQEVKCLGSKICKGHTYSWGYVDLQGGEQETEYPISLLICSTSKLKIKAQVKNGKTWKTLKGSSDSVSRYAAEVNEEGDDQGECPAVRPYATVNGNYFTVKSKGTKSYRYVITQKGKKPKYLNFKLKSSFYDADDYNGGDEDDYSGPNPSPSATKQLDRYVLDKISSAIRVTKNWDPMGLYGKDLRMVPSIHSGKGNVSCWLEGQSIRLPESASWVKEEYESGNISTDTANKYADAILDYWRSCPL